MALRVFSPAEQRGEAAVAIRGGVECLWDGPGAYGITALALFPGSGSVPAVDDFLTCQASQGGSDATCDFGSSVNGYWLSGTVDVGPGLDEASVTAATQPIIEASTASVEGMAAGVPFAEADGAWGDIDCDAIATGADVRGVLGRPALEVSPDFGGGPGELRAPSVLDAYRASTQFCSMRVPDAETSAQNFSFTAYPGGGAVGDVVAAVPGATEVAVSGIDRVTVLADSGVVTIDVIDGANWLTMVAPEGDKDLYLGVIPALVAALEETAT